MLCELIILASISLNRKQLKLLLSEKWEFEVLMFWNTEERGEEDIVPRNWDEHLPSAWGAGREPEREIWVSQSSLCRAASLSRESVA